MIFLKLRMWRVALGGLIIVIWTLVLLKFTLFSIVVIAGLLCVSLALFFWGRLLYEKGKVKIKDLATSVIASVIKKVLKSLVGVSIGFSSLCSFLVLLLPYLPIPPEYADAIANLTKIKSLELLIQALTTTSLGIVSLCVPYIAFSAYACLIIFGVRPPGATLILKANEKAIADSITGCYEKVYAYECNEKGEVKDYQVELVNRLCTIFVKTKAKKHKAKKFIVKICTPFVKFKAKMYKAKKRKKGKAYRNGSVQAGPDSNHAKTLYLLRGHSGFGKSVALARTVEKFTRSLFHNGRIPVVMPIRELVLSDLGIFTNLGKNDYLTTLDRDKLLAVFWESITAHHCVNKDDSHKEAFFKTIKTLHCGNHVIYLFDGLNEIVNLNDDLFKMGLDNWPIECVKRLRLLCGNNECLISSCDMPALTLYSTTVQSDNFFITGISSSQVKRDFGHRSITIADMARIPFFNRLMSDMDICDAQEEEYLPYRLIGNHLLNVALSSAGEKDIEKEEKDVIFCALATLAKDAYSKQGTINGSFSIDSTDFQMLGMLERKGAGPEGKRPRILHKTLNEGFYFCHQRYWEYFMAHGALKHIKNGTASLKTSYRAVYEYMRGDTSDLANPDDPPQKRESLLSIVSDENLGNAMAMVLCEETGIREEFFIACNITLRDQHVKKEEKEKVISFLANHLSAENHAPAFFSEMEPCDNGVEAFVKKDLADFNSQAYGGSNSNQMEGNQKSEQMKCMIILHPCLSSHMQSQLFCAVMKSGVLPLQEFLLDYFTYSPDAHSSKEKKKRASFTTGNLQGLLTAHGEAEAEISSEVALRTKDYLIYQFPCILLRNQRNYWRFFSSCKHTKGFMRIRYLDIYFTSILYTLLLGWQIYCLPIMIAKPTIALFGGTLPLLSWEILIAVIKLVSLGVTLGSGRAWALQHIYPEDVYLQIFKNASDWVTLPEIVEFIRNEEIQWGIKAEKRRVVKEKEVSLDDAGGKQQLKNKEVPLLFRKVKNTSKEDAEKYFMLLFDWIRVRPSVVFYLAVVLSLMWAQLVIPGLSWVGIILICLGTTLIFLIPLSTYAYVFSKQNGKGKFKKGVRNTQRILFVLLFILVAISTYTHPLAFGFILVLLAGLFFWLWLVYINPVGQFAVEIKDYENRFISQMSFHPDINYSSCPKELITMAGMRAYHNKVQSSKHLGIEYQNVSSVESSGLGTVPVVGRKQIKEDSTKSVEA